MQSIGLLENNVLVRIDDVELKGFDGLRPIYTLVPKDDPGLADFQAARNALDRKMYGEALAHLKAVDSGMLDLAAKTLLDHIVRKAHLRGKSSRCALFERRQRIRLPPVNYKVPH